MGKVLHWCALWLTVIAAPVLAEEPPLSLTVLGSGGPGAVGRASSGYLVSVDGAPRILVDAGPGTFARLGETGLSLAKTDIILLTHLHADHAGELPGLIKARAVAVRAPISFSIFGPQGHQAKGEDSYFPATSRFVDQLFGRQGAFAYLSDFSGHITFNIKDLPSNPKAGLKPSVIYSEGDLTIRAIPGHHRDAPAVIYRIEHGGKSITFTGDIDSKGHDDLKTIAAGTSLLVFNAVVLDPPAAPPILYTLHTAPTDIGSLAQQSGAGRLLLSHLSPATDQNRTEVEAAIRRSYSGPIKFAEDKEQITP
ncbi:MAG TPA: MBL fold metallo-hydrolase [Magnetospirillaceae bacterium]|nr:MBL fold metallo-hydrolase [Magnetospirillaceae bacterium]